MEIDNLIRNLQKVKDEGQSSIDITIGHEDKDLFQTYDYEIHGEEGVREIFINVGFDSKITNPEEPKIRCNNCMLTFRSDEDLLNFFSGSEELIKVCPKCKKSSYLMQPYTPTKADITNKDSSVLESSPIEIINKINQSPGFTARSIIALGGIESVLVEDDAKQIVVVPNEEIGLWFLNNLEESSKERRIHETITQKY